MSISSNWFEIPVINFERAVKFYEHIFQTTLRHEDLSDARMAIFSSETLQPRGALVKFENFQPSTQGPGTIVFLDVPHLKAVLHRITAAGGQCVFGPEASWIPDSVGTFALMIDSEGNRVGLHQSA